MQRLGRINNFGAVYLCPTHKARHRGIPEGAPRPSHLDDCRISKSRFGGHEPRLRLLDVPPSRPGPTARPGIRVSPARTPGPGPDS